MNLKDRLQQIYGVESSPSSLRQRLEKLQNAGRPASVPSQFPVGYRTDQSRWSGQSDPSDHQSQTVEYFLGGCWKENRHGRIVIVERNYPDFHRRGLFTLEETYRVDGRKVALLTGDSALEQFNLQEALFFDTETTGLAGGAGTCAFLIGTGFFVGSDFRTVQFFLPDFESEHAFLTEFAELVTALPDRCFRYLVSFNGKSFDVPLIETRFILQRLDNPCTALKHLDLLHPCRSLWKSRVRDCSLQSLERSLMGYVRVGDIPSALIPSTYFSFLHWGQFGGLKEIIDHNRDDVLSMPVLLGLACRCIEEGFRPEAICSGAGPTSKSDNPSPAEINYFAGLEPVSGLEIDSPEIDLMDRLSAARLYLRRGCHPQAAWLLERLLESEELLDDFRLEVVLELVRTLRRLGEYQRALGLCQEVIAHCDPPPLEAFQHAAKILEHRERRLEDALTLVLRAMELYPHSEDLERRRQRLENRLSR